MYVDVSELQSVLTAVDSPNDDDYQGTAAELDETLLEIAIEDAQAQVDTALNKLYTTPFSEPPVLIKAITRAIAAFNADVIFRKSTVYPQLNGNPLYIRYQWALNMLEQIRISKISIYSTVEGSSAVYHQYEPALFDMRRWLMPAETYRGDW